MTNQNTSILENVDVNAPTIAKPEVSDKAKDNILKIMTKLITSKGEGVNGWYSRMISTYDIRSFLLDKGYRISITQIDDVVNALIDDKLIRYYLIPNTNYVSLGLTQFYYDLMDDLLDETVHIINPDELAI